MTNQMICVVVINISYEVSCYDRYNCLIVCYISNPFGIEGIALAC